MIRVAAAPRGGPDTIERSRGMDRIFTAVANRIAAFVGQPLAFAGATGFILAWAAPANEMGG